MKELIDYLKKCKYNKFFNAEWANWRTEVIILNVSGINKMKDAKKICEQLNQVLLELKRAAEKGGD